MKQILILSSIILAALCAKKVESAQVDISSSEETELPYELTQDKYNELLDAYKLPDQPVYANGKKVDPENIIDANSNDIEDGWEREIVFKYYEDLVKVNLYMSNAHAETKLTKLYIEGDSSQFKEIAKESNLIFSCLNFLTKNYDDSLLQILEEDKDHKDFILKRDSAITKVVGGGMDFGIDPEECDKYKDANLWKQ